MKLFTVPITIEFDMLVVAENRNEAESVALDNVGEEMRWNDPQTDAGWPQEITGFSEIPREWHGSRPLAGSNGRPSGRRHIGNRGRSVGSAING